MPLAVGIIADSYTAPGGGAWEPTDIAGLAVWSEADDASTFTYSSSTIVSQWNDKSGNARNFTQGTVANQPNRNGTQNSLTTVVFDGTNDTMSCTTASTAVDNFTMFLACQRTGGSATTCVPFYNGSPGGSGYGIAMRANGTQIGILRGGIGWTASGVTDPAAACVITARRTAGTWSMHVNGVSAGFVLTAAPNTPGTSTVLVSASHLFAGSIFEALLYGAALSDSDRGDVEDYLMTKWGITPLTTPTSITGCQVWFDASDTASITSSGGAVSQWNDKSGNARHVTQGTAGNRPTTGTNTINGLNVLAFDGTNDALATSGNVQIVHSSTGEWSAFTVAKPITAVTGIRCLATQDGTTRIFNVRMNNPSVNAMAFNNTGTNFQDTEGSYVVNAVTMQTVVRGATTVQTWKDGASAGSTATTGTPQNSGALQLAVGHQNAASPSSWWLGDIAEIIVYDTALSTTDRVRVELYLRAKWGITT